MNENCRKQRPQYLSRIVFVIEHSAARLSEHDISRRHESGLLTNVAEIRAQSFLSLEPGHYLTRRALTNCAGPSVGSMNDPSPSDCAMDRRD